MGAANKLYNGNIAETFWSTATDGGFVRNYGYKYDQLNRLKEANYQKSGQVTGMYNENLSYDKNGNIMNLSRYGDRDEQYLPIQIDNLGYTYATNSNKLLNVADTSNNTSGFNDFNKTGDDYLYDANGNMTVDKNKNITAITYNHLNLPTKIIFPTGNIVYFYNASGQKVQKVVTENTTVTTTDYLGGYQYKNSVLQFFPTAEGYVKSTPVSGTNTYSYVFNYTDHLGNVRLSYTKDATTGSLKILEESNYYPFGLKHNGYNPITPITENRRLYNGKELQQELGLNMTAMDYRQYDNTLGRFNSVDVLSELAYSISPYRFANNNPIYYSDPTGLYEVDKNGNINISNPNEIKAMMGFLNHNKVATVKDIENHIIDDKNGFIKEVYLEGVTVNSRSSKSINNFQNNVQNQMNSYNNQTVSGLNISGHQLNSFDNGFIGADKTDMRSDASIAGYLGLVGTKTENILKYTAQTTTGWANKASALKAAKATVIAGRTLGVIGVLLTAGEDINNDKVGVGTGVKVTIGLATTFLGGPVIVGYAIFDITVGVTTGTSLTDRIASGIEETTK